MSEQCRELDKLGSTRGDCKCPRSCRRYRDLIYLSIQIRQNTKAVRSSSIQNLVQSFSTTAQAAVENEYVVPLLLKANTGPENLTEEERGRLHFWFIMTFRRFEGVYFQRDLGIVDADVIDGFERSHVAVLASRSAEAWWANSKAIFNRGFVTYVEELLKKDTLKTLHPVFRPRGEPSP